IGSVALDGEILVAVDARGGFEAVENKRTALQKDLQRKEIAPLSHRRMQRCADSGVGVLEDGEDVVLDPLDLPVEIRNQSVNDVEAPAEMKKEIEHVNALVEHDAAAGELGL